MKEWISTPNSVHSIDFYLQQSLDPPWGRLKKPWLGRRRLWAASRPLQWRRLYAQSELLLGAKHWKSAPPLNGSTLIWNPLIGILGMFWLAPPPPRITDGGPNNRTPEGARLLGCLFFLASWGARLLGQSSLGKKGKVFFCPRKKGGARLSVFFSGPCGGSFFWALLRWRALLGYFLGGGVCLLARFLFLRCESGPLMPNLQLVTRSQLVPRFGSIGRISKQTYFFSFVARLFSPNIFFFKEKFHCFGTFSSSSDCRVDNFHVFLMIDINIFVAFICTSLTLMLISPEIKISFFNKPLESARTEFGRSLKNIFTYFLTGKI